MTERKRLNTLSLIKRRAKLDQRNWEFLNLYEPLKLPLTPDEARAVLAKARGVGPRYSRSYVVMYDILLGRSVAPPLPDWLSKKK